MLSWVIWNTSWSIIVIQYMVDGWSNQNIDSMNFIFIWKLLSFYAHQKGMWEKRWEEMKRKEDVERRRLTETKRRESAGFTLQCIFYCHWARSWTRWNLYFEALSIMLKWYFISNAEYGRSKIFCIFMLQWIAIRYTEGIWTWKLFHLCKIWVNSCKQDVRQGQ